MADEPNDNVSETNPVTVQNTASNIAPQSENERLAVLVVQTVVNSELARRVGSAIEKFAEGEVESKKESTAVEKIKADVKQNEIELEKQRLTAFTIFDSRVRIEKYIGIAIFLAVLFVLFKAELLDGSSLRSLLLVFIGIVLKTNWDDIFKFFNKPDKK